MKKEMKKTLVMAFGSFLENDQNSSQKFLENLPEPKGITKKILPVGYFKQDIIKPIKEHHPERIIILGMHNGIKNPRFETVAKNLELTLKNPTHRFFVGLYSYWLKWNNKNLRINKPIPKDKLTEIAIDKNGAKQIKLHTKILPTKGIDVSKDAGTYVCNYAMWITERSIQNSSEKNTDFYFIHLPPRLNKRQEKILSRFILGLR